MYDDDRDVLAGKVPSVGFPPILNATNGASAPSVQKSFNRWYWLPLTFD